MGLEQSRVWFDVGVLMRDGVRLSTDIYFPKDGASGGPYPAVLGRTPYDNETPTQVEMARALADDGFVVALQDVRGRHDSDGEWLPFRNEGPDGYDTIEWIAEQGWCTGQVGTFGGSYGGWYQWAAAREKPPHLTTMISTATGGAWMEEVPFHNGCFLLVMLGWLHLVGGRSMQQPQLVDDWPAVLRHLPLQTMDERLGRSMPIWREWLSHPTLDEYWQQVRLDDDFAHIDVPALHITGWYDGDQPGALYFHRGMTGSSPRARDQHIVIGPWDHAGTRVPKQVLGGVDFGPSALEDIIGLHKTWFGHWLRGGGDQSLDQPRARLFRTGANEWHHADAWPLPSTEVSWYLHSAGRANTLVGDGSLSAEPPSGDEPADSFGYDPNDPVPSVLDENFYSPAAVETPLDRRFQHRRDDVLSYTCDVRGDSLVISGHPRVRLFASSDGLDTDWFLALHDIAPTGASMLLCEGRMRARFRTSLARETLLEPGATYEYEIELSAVNHLLRPGHRLRLTVTSSDFPTWDRNPNTGVPIGTDTALRAAINTVHHGASQPSALVLPVADQLDLDSA